MDSLLLVTLARLLVYEAALCLPFVLYGWTNRHNVAGFALGYPLFLGVPAALPALIVFAPFEAFLAALGLGLVEDVAVPLAGAGVARLILGRPNASIGIPVAVVLGLLWRLSDWIVRLIAGVAQSW